LPFLEEEIIAEYEALLTSEEEMFSEMLQKSLEEEVVCPVCQKTTVEIDSAFRDGPCIVCPRCCLRISGHTSLKNFGLHIQSCVSDHSNVCSAIPQFHVVAEDDSTHIYMACAQCSYLNVIS
jgi:predicted amidophosphoribosyltransferase